MFTEAIKAYLGWQAGGILLFLGLCAIVLVVLYIGDAVSFMRRILADFWRWLRLTHTTVWPKQPNGKWNLSLSWELPILSIRDGANIGGAVYFRLFLVDKMARAYGFYLNLGLVNIRFNVWRFNGSR